jgi:UDP-glucose 4-epimerase
MKKALVTGGAGFVGHHLVRALVARGVHVSVLDDLSTGKQERLATIPHHFYRGSITSKGEIMEALRDVDTVFHLAALVSVEESVRDPARAFSLNDTATRLVLDCAAEVGVSRFVYSSSAAVFGNVTMLPVSESTPCAPVSPYGASKLASETYVLAHPTVRTVALRYFNIIGVGQDPQSPYAAVVPIFIDRIRRGAPIVIFGDGTQTRDFVSVEDVAEANIAAASAPLTQNELCVIGTGIETSLLEVYTHIERISGLSVPVTFAPARAGDILRSVSDPTHAHAVLGWRASRSIDDSLHTLLT